jgi:hypothetical protein
MHWSSLAGIGKEEREREGGEGRGKRRREESREERKGFNGISLQVAQATSVTNVHFKCAPGSQCQGMWMENGSGGFFSDLVFEGGIYGLWVGNQQFTSRNITITGTSLAAVYVNWDWVSLVFGLYFRLYANLD